MNKFKEKKKVEMTTAFSPQPIKLVLNKPVCAGKKRDSSVLGKKKSVVVKTEKPVPSSTHSLPPSMRFDKKKTGELKEFVDLTTDK